MLTKAELAEIKARADAATEGPWCWTYAGHKDNGYMIGKAYQDGVECAGHVENDDDFEDPILIGEHEAATVNYGNPHFIAHSRSDVPALLAHIEELETKAKQVRDEALEEAAGVCATRGERLSDSDDYWGPTYANRIRALKEQNNG